MGMVINSFWGAAAGGGGTLRASRISYVNNASSATVSFPTGSLAGDTCVLFIGHGWNNSDPAGWTQLSNTNAANCNGSTYVKTLSSGDISTGSVTVFFAGVYYGVIAMATMVGAMTVRTSAFVRSSGTASTTGTCTTDGTPVSGDFALWFTMARANITCTCSDGTQLETTSNSEGSGCLNKQTLGASGAASGHFTYSSGPTSGYYESGVILH